MQGKGNSFFWEGYNWAKQRTQVKEHVGGEEDFVAMLDFGTLWLFFWQQLLIVIFIKISLTALNLRNDMENYFDLRNKFNLKIQRSLKIAAKWQKGGVIKTNNRLEIWSLSALEEVRETSSLLWCLWSAAIQQWLPVMYQNYDKPCKT